MRRGKKAASATLMVAGSVTLCLVLYRMFVEMMMAPGDPSQVTSSVLGYLLFSIVCIVVGVAMWQRFRVPVAEFALVGGAFC